jgi:hypothetical protein
MKQTTIKTIGIIGAGVAGIGAQDKIKNRRGSIKAFTEDGIVLENGERIECDIVIFGTASNPTAPFCLTPLKKHRRPMACIFTGISSTPIYPTWRSSAGPLRFQTH